jgi:hypothetical protein
MDFDVLSGFFSRLGINNDSPFCFCQYLSDITDGFRFMSGRGDEEETKNVGGNPS